MNEEGLFTNNATENSDESLDQTLDNHKLNQTADKVPNSTDSMEDFVSPVLSLGDNVETRILEDEMQSSYLTYAMSVIVSRALPDVRDGLKPVHRRIIYVINKMGLTPGAKYRKCAQVVGEVLGKYHPHGDLSVYNALVRLAQDFSMRYPLIDGQGNFGSVDGDSAAAMRYTECKMNKPTPYLVEDIEKDTVDFVDNYDGSQKEPRVLPTIFPNLIVNGQTGIAVGMATEIPPHNLTEVCQALLHLLRYPEASIEDLMQFILGPDLPTGGIIYGQADILQGYQTGRGKCAVRSKAELTESSIIVTEIPYQVNKSDMLIKIAEMIKDKKIEGIRDIRDESNKDGIRVVIETKRDASPEIILNQLYKMSDLQTNIHFNLLALVNKGRQPKLLNLKEILVEFLNHRDEVVVRRTKFDLNKAKDELHILDGLKIALDFIDEVISLIRASYDKAEASQKLQQRFKLSERQAEAILQMRLQTLTGLDKSKIENERAQKLKLIAELEEILNNTEVKLQLIETEIRELSEKFNSKRRTVIVKEGIGDYNKENFVIDEEVLIQLTSSQYIKILPITQFRQQGRGGRGITSFNPKDEDWVKTSLVCNSHDFFYAFTNLGRMFKTRVFDLPNGSRTGRGQALVNYLELRPNEKATNILTITKDQEQSKLGSIVFATKKGLVKRTNLDEFNNVRKSGIIAIGLREDDELVGACLSDVENDNIILSASNGKTVIFKRDLLFSLGRSAQGVKGMKLGKADYIISLQISDFGFTDQLDVREDSDNSEAPEIEESAEVLLDSEKLKTDTSHDSLDNLSGEDVSLTGDGTRKTKLYPSLLIITEKGFGKQTYLSEYRRTNRAASGVKTLNMTSKTGKPVLVQILGGQEESLIVTTRHGVTIRVAPEDISQLGRSTQGIKVIKLDNQDTVVSGSIN